MTPEVQASSPGRPETNGRVHRVPRSTLPRGVRIARDWTLALGVIGLGVYGLGWAVSQFSTIFVAVLVALLLSALLYPVVRVVATRIPRGLAALAVLLGALVVIAGLFTLVGEQVVSGFSDLSTQAAAGITEVENWLATGPLQLTSGQLASYGTEFENWLSTNKSTILSSVLGLGTSATHLVEGFFIMMFSLFFFLSAGHRIWAWLLRILPRAAQSPTDDAVRSGWVTLSHYVRATFIVAMVDGVGIGLGSALLGVPLALPLGVVVFFGAFIPVVGALITGVLAVLVALVAKGWVIALAVLGVVIAVNQLEAHVLQPFLLGRAVAVHPLGVILALAAGSDVAGVLGALFAVPAAAVANTVIVALANRTPRDPGEQIADDGAPLTPEKPNPTDVTKTPDSQHPVLE